ncbi:MAG TPA: metalloregulator ArsR/SmtB family transcription factor [Candidatus Limnocylindria bacterium]|nr:metalloregulator ArsR/SmtB family transcription factor [Candidatus Limnocylindria bacterium]
MSPTRRPNRPPIVSIEPSPAYELLQSIVVTMGHEGSDTYEVGAEWVAEMKARAGDDLWKRVEEVSLGDTDTFIHMIGLVHDTPAPRDVPAFLEHLRETDADEIRLHLVQFYSREVRRMTPPTVIRAAIGGDVEARREFLRTSYPEWEMWASYLERVLDVDGEAFKADLIETLQDWYERVWKPESLTIMPIVERDAEAKRALVRELPIDRFVTTATNGVEFAPRPGIDRVVMVPSFVNRPLVTYYEFGEALIIIYPVADENVSADSDAPPLRLVRLSKALGDEKRLRILRALADGEKTLMELADMFGVAKTTMHHHMIVLRSAGLISVGVGSKRYRLRQETVPDVGALLSGYLGAAPGPSAASGSPASPRKRRAAG